MIPSQIIPSPSPAITPPSSMDDDDEFSYSSDSDLFFDAPSELPPSGESDSAFNLSEPSTSESAGTKTCRRRSSAPRSSPKLHGLAVASDTPESPRARTREIPVSSSEEQVEREGDSSASGVTSDQAPVATDSECEAAVEEPASTDLGAWRQSPSDVLIYVAGLVIKVVAFQSSILISFILFPLRLLHFSCLMVVDPFGTMRRARDHVIVIVMRGFDVVRDRVCPLLLVWLRKQQGIGMLALRLGLGCFWACYVCIVLFGCLIMAFFLGRLITHYVVEEPIQIEEDLVFDYTKDSPVAYVPITSCHVFQSSSLDYDDAISTAKRTQQRRIPPNHKLQVTVSMALPESDYNINLGIFQVRVELLSADGRVIASSSRPCMLLFKSTPIHLVEVLFKSVPLLTGYSSESQIVRLNIKGFIEKENSTACIRVVIEQRAEYRPAAGIPEVYAASLKLESELPLVKRIIWKWRWTLFIWISMCVFLFELLIILGCCRPLILPRI